MSCLIVDHYSTTYGRKAAFFRMLSRPLSARKTNLFLILIASFFGVSSFIFYKTKTNYRSSSGFWQAGSGSYLIRPQTRFEITKLMLGLADLFRPVLLCHPWTIVLLPSPCMVEIHCRWKPMWRCSRWNPWSILHPISISGHTATHESNSCIALSCSTSEHMWLKYLDQISVWVLLKSACWVS